MHILCLVNFIITIFLLISVINSFVILPLSLGKNEDAESLIELIQIQNENTEDVHNPIESPRINYRSKRDALNKRKVHELFGKRSGTNSNFIEEVLMNADKRTGNELNEENSLMDFERNLAYIADSQSIPQKRRSSELIGKRSSHTDIPEFINKLNELENLNDAQIGALLSLVHNSGQNRQRRAKGGELFG